MFLFLITENARTCTAQVGLIRSVLVSKYLLAANLVALLNAVLEHILSKVAFFIVENAQKTLSQYPKKETEELEQ